MESEQVDSIETEHMTIAHVLTWSDQENCMYITAFNLLMIQSDVVTA